MGDFCFLFCFLRSCQCKYFFGSLYTVVGTSLTTRMGGVGGLLTHIMFIVPTIPFFWGFLFGCLLKVVMGSPPPHSPPPLPYPTLPYHHHYKTHLVYLVHFGKTRLAGEAVFDRELFYTNTTYIYTLCNLY